MKNSRKLIIGLLLFNAISATGGGIALMNGVIDQPSWAQNTDFASLYFPGAILMALVGGSALLGALTALKNTLAWELATLVSAVIMLFWIIGEIVSIQAFHWLQVIYLITASLLIWLTPTSKKVTTER